MGHWPPSTWDEGEDDANGARRYSDTEQVGRFFEILGSTIDVLAFEVDSITATDAGVVAQGSERGRFTANGQSYDMRWCHVMGIESGRVVSFTDDPDTAPMLEASHATSTDLSWDRRPLDIGDGPTGSVGSIGAVWRCR